MPNADQPAPRRRTVMVTEPSELGDLEYEIEIEIDDDDSAPAQQ